MVDKKKTKKSAPKKEEVCEIFELEKGNKEEVIKSCGNISEKKASKREINKENKVLRNVLIGMGIFAIIFILTFLFIREYNEIEYKGVKFTKIDYNGLPFYHTTFPIVYQGKPNTFNEFLRLNPERTVAKIPFEGKLIGKDDMVINFEEEFKCNGDGIIASANLVELYTIIGINVVKNESYSCDENGTYMYLNLREGDESKIVQTGPACYDLYIHDCEILAVTERFMIETIARVNENYQAS